MVGGDQSVGKHHSLNPKQELFVSSWVLMRMMRSYHLLLGEWGKVEGGNSHITKGRAILLPHLLDCLYLLAHTHTHSSTCTCSCNVKLLALPIDKNLTQTDFLISSSCY